MPEGPAYAEIRALRERLANLEEVARAIPPTGDLGTAIHDHYAAKPTPEQRRRALESAAYGWQPDPQREAEMAAWKRDPKGYEAAMDSMHAPMLPLLFYEKARSAAIKLDRFDPNATTEEETES